MTEHTENEARLETCHWPECGDPVAEDGGLCAFHAEYWEHVAEAEAWGMALETVGHLARAARAGLGLPQLDEAMEVAVERARQARDHHEAERERLEKWAAA